MWLYTNDRGELARMDNVPYFQITNKFTEGALEKELVAVLKKVTYRLSSLPMAMEDRLGMTAKLSVRLKSRMSCL